MSDRLSIARQAASGLRQFASQIGRSPALVGFDGFVDSIIAVVDKRHSPTQYTPIRTIREYAEKQAAAAGRSANYELIVKMQKLGGNGPIMANALLGAGLPVTYIGALGRPRVHAVFEDFAASAECHSICEPGMTDALEFDDGKLMLGKYETLNNVNPDGIAAALGPDGLASDIADARLLAMVNWTMLFGMNDIWRKLIDDVLPNLQGPRKLVFVDLADPEKRTRDDLVGALGLLGEMQAHADVLLGLNLNETEQVARVLDIDPTDTPGKIIEQLAVAIRQTLAIHGVVVHPRHAAAAALRDADGHVTSGRFAGPFVAQPKLSTGAGDNFNAGFCLGRLAGLGVEQTLCVGTATSGYYVRNAHSPSLNELATFCDDLPESE